ncbi:arad-like aldolase/epimerase, partial [Aureobasidium melanogenum]
MDHQRRFMLEHMAGAFRVFSRKGYTEGMSGHISLRDPENPEYFWTNPLGVHFGMVSVSDLILLDHDGQVVGGNTSRPANAAGFLIHSGLHKRYPHVNAACHTHSPNGKAWSTFAKPLDMINQDVTMFYGKALGVYEEFGGVVLDPGESERLADALSPQGKGLILRNHGLLTVGTTVDEAAYLFTLLERSCEIQLKVDAAAALGTSKQIIDDEAAEYTFRMTSDPEALYYEFQPDYEFEKRATGGDFLL